MWTSILQLMHQEVNQVTLNVVVTCQIHPVLNLAVSYLKQLLLKLNDQHNPNFYEKMLYTVLYMPSVILFVVYT